MTLLLAGWVLLAPWILLLRRALWLQATPPKQLACADIATRVRITLAMIDDAFRLAASATIGRQPDAAARILHGACAGTALLARDMRHELMQWGAATGVLDTAFGLDPLDATRLRLRSLRSLARVERGLLAVLQGELGHIRVRLFTLNLAWRVLQWHARSLRVVDTPTERPLPTALQLDLHVLAQMTLDAHSVLRQSAVARGADWRLAT